MKNIFILAFFLLLLGCAAPVLELKKEPLTGQEYCLYKCHLISLKKDEDGELILKYFKSDNLKVKPPIKAILKIAQSDRREYDINPHEILNLSIDGSIYPLDLVHSTKQPNEEIQYHGLAMPSGHSILLGSVKEVTRRGLAFFLPENILFKIVKAREVYFEIISPAVEYPSTNEKKSIILKFDPKNLESLEKFKSSCLVN